MWFACAKTKRIMTEYDAGGLSVSDRGMIESHLNACPSCRSEYEEMRQLRARLASAHRYGAPAGFSARVMRNLDAIHAPARPGTISLVFMRTVEAAMVLAVVAAGLISGNFIAEGVFPAPRPDNVDVTVNSGRSGAFLSYSIEAFDPAPPESIGAAFVTEARNEK